MSKNPVIVFSDRFTYGNFEFIADDSDLAENSPEVGCDFYMKSAKTGRTILFRPYLTIRDKDGDIIEWQWTSIEKVRGGNTMKVRIFND